LRLEGKPKDRAYEMGRLLRGPLSRDVVDYFSLKIFSLTSEKTAFTRALFGLAYNQVVRLFHRATPREYAEEIDALASGMGVDAIYVRRAVTLPDTGAALNALMPRSLPEGGCTSVVEKSENFVYGRNLDFAGAELWDKHPLLIQIEPPTGSRELRHVVFGADGALFGGITGVNEAGITFAVQQNYSNDAGLKGVPMMLIGEMVLREAKSLAEAENILRARRPAVLWTFVLTDLKTGEAMAVESSPRHFSVRRMDQGKFVQTNHLMNKETRQDEVISVGTKSNSVYRMEKSRELLDGNAGSAGAEKLARILAYQADPAGELAAYHDVMKAHTIQTVLFESAAGIPRKVFVSQDQAPTAGGTFVAFRFADLFRPGELPYELWNPTRPSPEKRQRQREISRAFHAYFDQKDIPAALALLAKHRTLDAALFRSVALYQLGRFGEAALGVNEALANPRFRDEPLYIRQSLGWVKLASLLREGKNAEAKILAEQIATENPPNLRLKELVEAVMAGRKPPAKQLQLAFEFFSGDLSAVSN
jgi:hypothetical protein